MFKFLTLRCSCCGAVICNLPDSEALDFVDHTLKCEDCFYDAKDLEFYHAEKSYKELISA